MFTYQIILISHLLIVSKTIENVTLDTVPDVLRDVSNQVDWATINMIKLPNEQKVKIGCFVAVSEYL